MDNSRQAKRFLVLFILLILAVPTLMGSFADREIVGNLKLTTDGKGLMFTSGTEEVWIYVSSVPDTPSSEGTVGEIAFDAHHLYRCIATNTWKRVDLSDWPIAEIRTIAGADLRTVADTDIMTAGEY